MGRKRGDLGFEISDLGFADNLFRDRVHAALLTVRSTSRQFLNLTGPRTRSTEHESRTNGFQILDFARRVFLDRDGVCRWFVRFVGLGPG
jgi:hypothetical protein